MTESISIVAILELSLWSWRLKRPDICPLFKPKWALFVSTRVVPRNVKSRPFLGMRLFYFYIKGGNINEGTFAGIKRRSNTESESSE